MILIQRSVLLVSLFITFVHGYGQIAQVVDANNFCIFLPPTDSVDRGIADTEWNAQAFCVGKTPKATNAGKIPSGFIQSAHFVATDEYVQVTGQINPVKAKLNPKDDGGQYDIKAPNGSSCAGWKYYVNLVEPSGNTYCMRCCNDPKTCNRGISEKGCAHIIPGDYSGPNGNSDSSNPVTTKKSATTTTKIAAITTSKPVTTTVATLTTPLPVAPLPAAANANANTLNNTTTPVQVNNNNPTSNNGQMLSQNDKVTEQSINSANSFEPMTVIMSASVILVSMVLMISQ